jgi:hypothetical protein
MPWGVGDVDHHKKGLTPEQKKKWVVIANGIYKDCLAKGGDDKTCAPKAIRIANSKFMEVSMKKTEAVKLSKSALCFNDHEAFASVTPLKEGGKRGIKMTAYSGKLIKNHWYWGDLAIDTSGLKLSKTNIPILEDHETDRKIGFGSFIVNDKHEVVADDMSYVDTPYSAEFIKLSDQGFPYEASISARPSKIQRLMENEETEVNGFKMKGPGTVWRESVLRECSVVTFGADTNTKSAAMAENEDVVMEVVETTVKPINEYKEVNMDLAKLKAEHPDLYAEVLTLGKAEAEAVFAPIKAGLDAKIAELSTEKERLSADNKDVQGRILKLEKEDTLRKEQGVRAVAEAVFTGKLKDSGIPERLHSKIRKQLDHEKFVKEGKLDVEAFSAAIVAELKDWVPSESDESDETEGTILGMSFTKSIGAQDMGNVDKMVERMLKSTGQATQ